MKQSTYSEYTCPSCEKPSLSLWFTVRNQYGQYPIACCRECRCGFVMPRPKVEEIESFYKNTAYRSNEQGSPKERFVSVINQEKSYPNSTIDAARIAATCRKLVAGNRFLDIGAGYGFFTQAAVKQGFQVTAIEPAISCQEVFRIMNGFAPIPGFLSDEFVAAHAGEFDVVLMSQVLEHIRDLDWTLSALRSLLRDGGIAAIAVPHFRSLISILQGRRDMFIIPPEHLNFFTPQGLERMFQRHGFITVASQTISHIDGKRIARKLRLGLLGGFVSIFIRLPMIMMDLVKMGIVMNSYFRKEIAISGK